jgi:hypothetical protein
VYADGVGFQDGQVIRVIMSATRIATSTKVVNSFVYDVHDATGSAGDPGQILADAFRDDVLTPFKALFTSAWGIASPIAEEVVDPLDPSAPRTGWNSTGGGVGSRSSASDFLPPGICGEAPVKSAFRGRRFNGRLFIPGSFTELDQADGVFTATPIALMQAYLDAVPRSPDVDTGLGERTADWSIFSRTQRVQGKDPYLVPVVSAVASSSTHFLRSRVK